MHRLIGLMFVLVGFVAVPIGGGGFAVFLDVPSLMLVALLTAGGLLMTARPAELLDATRAVFVGPGEADPAQRLHRVRVMAFGHQVAWAAGLAGSLLGLIAMLADLSDPSAIGAAMALALLATLYGAALAEFGFAPCRQILLGQMDIEPASSEGATVSAGAPWRSVCVVLLMLVLFLTLVVGFSGNGAAGVFPAGG